MKEWDIFNTVLHYILKARGQILVIAGRCLFRMVCVFRIYIRYPPFSTLPWIWYHV
jgi:hypothetical protein